VISTAALITRVGRYLTDYDSTDPAYQHVEWSKRDLQDYIQTAALMLSAAVPDASTCRRNIPLVGDSVVDLPDGCNDVLKVLAYVDAAGKQQVNVREIKEAAGMYVSTRPVCAGTATATAGQSITVRHMTDAGDTLIVEPALKGGHLMVTCACSPDMSSPTAVVNMAAKYEPIIFWWAVSMAFGTDIESASMRERSDVYWERGAALLRAVAPNAQAPTRKA
jgi:hypothetical protein